jgi:chitodextrinase
MWQASQDNVGVKDYTVKRNGVIQNTTDKLYARDYKVQGGVWYRYEVQARDAAGNLSPVSSVNALGQCFLVWCWLK